MITIHRQPHKSIEPAREPLDVPKRNVWEFIEPRLAWATIVVLLLLILLQLRGCL